MGERLCGCCVIIAAAMAVCLPYVVYEAGILTLLHPMTASEYLLGEGREK